MADQRFDRAIMALHRFEESVASVDRCDFGGVYRCSQAPTLRPLNFVRVDDAKLGLDATVTGARAAAKQHGLTAIVVDVSFGLNTNAKFEDADGSGKEWVRVPRGIYVLDGNPPTPAHQVQRISLDEFIAARRVFFAATSHYDATQIKEEEEATRVLAGAMPTQQWGAPVPLVSRPTGCVDLLTGHPARSGDGVPTRRGGGGR